LPSNPRLPVHVLKMCGFTQSADIDTALSVGATHIGFILVASSPRAVSVKTAVRLSQFMANRPDHHAKRVGVFMNQPIGNVQAMAQAIGLDMIQLHGQETVAYCQKLAAQWPVIKACSLSNPANDLQHVHGFAPVVHALLLDMPKQTALPWLAWHTTLAEHTQTLQAPWWLAGGLTPDNIQEVLALYQQGHAQPPCGVDVASGIETLPGVKDAKKMKAFVEHARLL
jgi:phosphoribosylanthranilate isomerase